VQAKAIYQSPHKGIMTPPVLLDLTGDGVVDIVFATYNSTALALDGQTYATLWNFTYSLSETYALVMVRFCGYLCDTTSWLIKPVSKLNE